MDFEQLSTRTKNALITFNQFYFNSPHNRSHIKRQFKHTDPKEFTRFTIEEVHSIRGIGFESLGEIAKWIRTNGYSFKEKAGDQPGSPG